MSDPDSYPYKPCKNINDNSLSCLIENNNSGCCKNTDESTTLPYQPYNNQDNQCSCASGTILTTCPIQQVDNGIAYNDSSEIGSNISFIGDYHDGKMGVAVKTPELTIFKIGYVPNGGYTINNDTENLTSDEKRQGDPCQIPCSKDLKTFPFFGNYPTGQTIYNDSVFCNGGSNKYINGTIKLSAIYDPDNISCIIPICVSNSKIPKPDLTQNQINPITGIPTFS